MPSAASPRVAERTRDDLDNLFNFDDDIEDFLKDIPIERNSNNAPQEPTKNIDEEITVKKKRAPVPKLDETLLQSNKGLPKLRKITKSRLKFRGKGHEFADMEMLLNTYQLWLDDLYPRAKFRDALSMVEKLGHSKRMQVMRRAWLDETKPQAREPSPEVVEQEEARAVETEAGAAAIRVDLDSDEDIFGGQTRKEQQNAVDKDAGEGEAPGEDELDALMAESIQPAESIPPAVQKKGPFEEEDYDDDDLDALMAEQSASLPDQPPPRQGAGSARDIFADEEEAMAEMDMW